MHPALYLYIYISIDYIFSFQSIDLLMYFSTDLCVPANFNVAINSSALLSVSGGNGRAESARTRFHNSMTLCNLVQQKCSAVACGLHCATVSKFNSVTVS